VLSQELGVGTHEPYLILEMVEKSLRVISEVSLFPTFYIEEEIEHIVSHADRG